MQDTRANMGAHLKWDIPMFLGIASTKDGRARAPIDHVVNPTQYLSSSKSLASRCHYSPPSSFDASKDRPTQLSKPKTSTLLRVGNIRSVSRNNSIYLH